SRSAVSICFTNWPVLANSGCWPTSRQGELPLLTGGRLHPASPGKGMGDGVGWGVAVLAPVGRGVLVTDVGVFPPQVARIVDPATAITTALSKLTRTASL